MPGFQSSRRDEPLLSVDVAQEKVLAEAAPLGTERVQLDEALGRTLREDVAAAEDAPAADNSAMDGYAVRAEDLEDVAEERPVRLKVLGDVPAGAVSALRVERGTAMRIMTGAVVPEGADTVVQVELTDAGRETVSIHEAPGRGANIRRRGEDVRAGETVLRAGTPIGASEIAMLAGQRRTEVVAGTRPVVAILSTGDELISIDEPPAPGKIVNTNSWLLSALVRDAGAVPRDLGIVRDTREETIAALERAAESDVILTTGGVSVGAFDFVKDALDALGAETKFWRVAMKPGKPVVLSRLRGRLCFGLPGNPVSAFVGFHLFVAPALRKMLGRTEVLPAVVNVRMGAPLKGASDRRVYFRARVVAEDGELVARPMRSQSSGSLASMAGANGLVVVEAGTRADAGSVVPAVLIGAIGQGALAERAVTLPSRP